MVYSNTGGRQPFDASVDSSFFSFVRASDGAFVRASFHDALTNADESHASTAIDFSREATGAYQ